MEIPRYLQQRGGNLDQSDSVYPTKKHFLLNILTRALQRKPKTNNRGVSNLLWRDLSK